MNKILNNKIIESKLTSMRDKNTNSEDFKNRLEEISALMAYETSEFIKMSQVEIETPTFSKIHGTKISEDILLIPILRAGLGMLSGFQFVFKEAYIGEIGVKRNEETFEISKYKFDLPNVNKNIQIFLLDPMLATGNSASEVIKMLKREGFININFIGLIGVEEGIKKLNIDHPEVNIMLAHKDKILNEKKYIIPGLGDAGDRLFGEMEK